MKIGMIGVKAVPAIGGIAAYTEEIGARLVARGHEVTVYCRPKFLGSDTEPAYRGMQRRISRGIASKHLDAFTHTLSSIREASRSHFDILHFHGVGPCSLIPLARSIARAKIVATVHGFEWQSSKWGPGAKAFLWAADRFCLHAAHALTVVSATMLDHYRGADGLPVAFIPTGVNEAEPRPPRLIRERFGLGGGDYILFLGRLVPEKGCHLLLSAYRQIATTTRLVLAGAATHGGQYEKKLRSLADERVIFTGYVSGRLKEELLSNAYLVAQPSHLEGMSVAVLEAISYGRFVIAGDLPGNREAMGEFGMVTRPGDVEDLRAKLAFCLERPRMVQSQSSEGIEWVRKERNWDRTVDELEKLYRRLVQREAPIRA